MSSSSSSNTFLSFPCEIEDQNRGFPRVCHCGARVVMRTSRTPRNPGRLFHVCVKKSEFDPFHTWKWTNEALVEEVEDMKSSICNCETLIKFQEEELKRLNVKIRGCEEESKNMRGELNRFKVIVVAGFVVVGYLLFFSN